MNVILIHAGDVIENVFLFTYHSSQTVMHDDGDVELRGRVDDMVLSGGENIHPEEIETVLLQHPAVRDAAIIGMPDDKWTERVVACVVVDGVDGADAAALDAWCKDSSLANYKRPREYLFLDVLPRNAANKVLRRELKVQAAPSE